MYLVGGRTGNELTDAATAASLLNVINTIVTHEAMISTDPIFRLEDYAQLLVDNLNRALPNGFEYLTYLNIDLRPIIWSKQGVESIGMDAGFSLRGTEMGT